VIAELGGEAKPMDTYAKVAEQGAMG